VFFLCGVSFCDDHQIHGVSRRGVSRRADFEDRWDDRDVVVLF